MAEKTIQIQQRKETTDVVATRGRRFEGTVMKVFDKRAVIEFERTVPVHKYERFMRKKTRLHARIPTGMHVAVGDYVKVQECRPLSKMIHSVILAIIRKAHAEEKKQ